MSCAAVWGASSRGTSRHKEDAERMNTRHGRLGQSLPTPAPFFLGSQGNGQTCHEVPKNEELQIGFEGGEIEGLAKKVAHIFRRRNVSI